MTALIFFIRSNGISLKNKAYFCAKVYNYQKRKIYDETK